jgi:hypothetical protein
VYPHVVERVITQGVVLLEVCVRLAGEELACEDFLRQLLDGTEV